MLKSLTMFCLLVGIVHSNVINMNHMVDKFLDNTRKKIILEHGDVVQIPDLQKAFPFGLHIGGSDVSWTLDCTRGYLKDMSTLRRTGDVVLVGEGRKFTLDATLGFDTLEFGFRSCNISVDPFFTVNRRFSAVVGKNSIHSRASVALNGTNGCRPSLECIHVREAEDIQARTTGGLIDSLESSVVSAMVAHFHDQLVQVLVKNIEDAAKEAMAETTFC